MNKRLSLPNVTLCAVTSQDANIALLALRKCMAQVDFGAAKLISAQALAGVVDVEIVRVPPIVGIEEYSRFMMKDIGLFIETDHVLIAQWDGFLVRPDCWDPAFLDYDYIGASWPQFARGLDVGNGGFSLRSARLLRSLRDDIVQVYHPEDIGICHVNRRYLEERYAIRFAPLELARRFSREREQGDEPSFGFHGAFNFVDMLGVEAADYLDACPPHLFDNRAGYDLIEYLLRSYEPRLYRHGWQLLRAVSLKRTSRRQHMRMRLKRLLHSPYLENRLREFTNYLGR